MMDLVRHRIGTIAASAASTERSRPRALAERARAGPARPVTELDWRAARRTTLHPADPRGHTSVRVLFDGFVFLARPFSFKDLLASFVNKTFFRDTLFGSGVV